MTKVMALVLAGSRGGGDPVALAAGVSHKAFAPVAGKPMLARVLTALKAERRIGRVGVVIETPVAAREDPDVAGLLAADDIVITPCETPSLSVLAGLDALGARYPVLVTTADHPLLTPAMVSWFLDHLPDAAVAAGVAREETVRRIGSRTRRTYFRFRDGGFSGCNLFFLRDPGARAAVTFWRRIERDRKRPWRILGALGHFTLIRYISGRLSLADAMDRLGRCAGTSVGIVEMPFPEAAVDVDSPDDLVLAESILRQRAPEGTAP